MRKDEKQLCYEVAGRQSHCNGLAPTSTIQSTEDWSQRMLETVQQQTKELPLMQDCPAVDAHLLHL